MTNNIKVLNNNMGYNFRAGKTNAVKEIKEVLVILKNGEQITLLASKLNRYLQLHKSDVFTYNFI